MTCSNALVSIDWITGNIDYEFFLCECGNKLFYFVVESSAII